jgi:hypothetical protein
MVTDRYQIQGVTPTKPYSVLFLPQYSHYLAASSFLSTIPYTLQWTVKKLLEWLYRTVMVGHMATLI